MAVPLVMVIVPGAPLRTGGALMGNGCRGGWFGVVTEGLGIGTLAPRSSLNLVTSALTREASPEGTDAEGPVFT